MKQKSMYLIRSIILLLIVIIVLFTSVPHAQAKGLPKAKSGKWIPAIVTQYSAAETCPNGDYQRCINASGRRPVFLKSLACPRSVKKGSNVLINGHVFQCDDRTALRYDGRYDIYVESYQEAIKFGKQKLMIFIYEHSNERL